MGRNLDEHPTFNYLTLITSIADLIKSVTPEYSVYMSPINAGKTLPRWFILIRGEQTLENQIDRTYMKVLKFDLVYEQDYNLINLYKDYVEKASLIEAALKNLKYNVRNQNNEITKSIPLDAHDIRTSWDQSGMHCYFNLNLRLMDSDVSLEEWIKKVNWDIYIKEAKNE